jgi:hypothetical protein
MRIVSGTITNGVTLAASDSPVLIGGVVTNDGTGATVGVYGGSGIYGDIRNFGTVGDTGTFIGIELTAAGTIVNGSPLAGDALITGNSYGVKLLSDATLSNFGTITSAFAGARIEGGGRLTNSSGGLISGGVAEGVSFDETATVVNDGSIFSASFIGVDMVGGGRVVNGASAITESTVSGSQNGVSFVTGVATLSNFGTITSTASNGSAVQAGSGITSFRVTNGAAASNAALISGVTGVVDSAGSGTITNFGTILGTGVSGEGIKLSGGVVANGSAASTKARIQGHFLGVYLSAAGRITNFGTIAGGGGAILLTAGGTIVNGGRTDPAATIGTGSDGIDTFGTVAATVTNFGTISGTHSAISFGEANDVLTVAAGAKFVGAVSGGAGVDTVTFTGGGTLAIAKFSGFEHLVLSATSRDALTLTSANFAGVTAATIIVSGGAPGDTLNAGSLGSGSMLVYQGGSGADIITAGKSMTITAAGGANELIFKTAGNTDTLTDFAASASNEIVFGNAVFDLGLSGASGTPKPLPANLFAANKTGACTTTTQRFAYDTKNGKLFFDKDGSGSASHQLVATLTGAPHLAAADLFYIS